MGESEKAAGGPVETHAVFECPFCPEATIIIGDTEDGDTVLVHSVPPCPTFAGDAPIAFLQRVRRHLRNTDRNLS